MHVVGVLPLSLAARLNPLLSEAVFSIFICGAP